MILLSACSILLLAGFQGSDNYREVPQVMPYQSEDQLQVTPHSQMQDTPRDVPRLHSQDIPAEAVGCWNGTIYSSDVETKQLSSLPVGPWVNETYRICIGGNSSIQVGATIVPRSSETTVTPVDEHHLQIHNRLMWDDMGDSVPVGGARWLPRLVPHPCAMEQLTDILAHVTQGHLEVSATAWEYCNGVPVYRNKWNKIFTRN
jgi:hypothetical protein